MNDHAHLPYSACRVIKASRVLTEGEKLVWLEDFGLDGIEGAWISHENLAERLGMTGGSVHVIRKRLQALELHESVPRPGARTRGWHCLLPAACVPSARPSPNEIRMLVEVLDRHLDHRKLEQENGRQLVMPITGRRQRSLPATGNGGLRHKESSGASSGDEVGASPSSSSRSENSPVSSQQEAGVFAHANERRGGSPVRIGDSPELQRYLGGATA